MAASSVASNPNRCQLVGAEQGCQRRGVAAVSLDVVAGPRRNQRGRNHHAVVPQQGDLPMQAIEARPRFIAESKFVMLGGEKAGLNILHAVTQKPEALTQAIRAI